MNYEFQTGRPIKPGDLRIEDGIYFMEFGVDSRDAIAHLLRGVDASGQSVFFQVNERLVEIRPGDTVAEVESHLRTNKKRNNRIKLSDLDQDILEDFLWAEIEIAKREGVCVVLNEPTGKACEIRTTDTVEYLLKRLR